MSEVQFRSLLVILVLAYAAVFSGMVQADDPVSKSRISGVAIGGHDTVAYHDLQRAPQADAVEGLKTYTVEHQGAKWRNRWNDGNWETYKEQADAAWARLK